MRRLLAVITAATARPENASRRRASHRRAATARDVCVIGLALFTVVPFSLQAFAGVKGSGSGYYVARSPYRLCASILKYASPEFFIECPGWNRSAGA